MRRARRANTTLISIYKGRLVGSVYGVARGGGFISDSALGQNKKRTTFEGKTGFALEWLALVVRSGRLPALH